jgi:hypothetical protein
LFFVLLSIEFKCVSLKKRLFAQELDRAPLKVEKRAISRKERERERERRRERKRKKESERSEEEWEGGR